MSANLLDGLAPKLFNGTTEDGGTYHHAASSGHYDLLSWDLAGQSVLATNQTYHVGLSVMGASAAAQALWMAVGYRDDAGNRNWVHAWLTVGTSWGRAEGTLVVPSGMTPFGAYVTVYGDSPELWMASPTLSLGSPVPLASSAHTPYATQDHVAAEYATKAALKVTSDAVTAEVTERGKLAGRVGTLESTTGTHTSKLSQLAASITSLVKGESTYTDPDGKSATSGIYSLVTQTRDSVTALFGGYTKTEDLASTAAVQEAKKAGTDAASAASAAQSTADTAKANAATAQSTADTAKSDAASAQSTADGAKSTADGLSTLIRADSDGVTVGKSEDGKTYATGRTRMTGSAFQVLDKAGAVITQLAADGASFLSGLVRIVAGKVTLPGNLTVNSITIDSGGGVAVLRGIVSRISANLNGVTSSVSAGWEQDFGYGVTAIVRESAHLKSGEMVPERMASTHLASDKAELYVGDNSMKVTGDSFSLSHPEYLRSAIGVETVAGALAAGAAVADLDTCGTGVFSYDAATANRPTDYGVCLSLSAASGIWLFQLALPTQGDPHWRRNINGAGWEGWWQWATS